MFTLMKKGTSTSISAYSKTLHCVKTFRVATDWYFIIPKINFLNLFKAARHLNNVYTDWFIKKLTRKIVYIIVGVGSFNSEYLAFKNQIFLPGVLPKKQNEKLSIGKGRIQLATLRKSSQLKGETKKN